MAFGSTLLARLGLDSAGFSSGLRNAAQEARNTSSQIEDGFNRAAHGADGIFTSSHRAARQLENLTKQLASGASVADVLTTGLQGAERALKLPLGSLAILGALVVLVEKMSEANREAVNLNREIATLTRGGSNPHFATLEAMESKLDELQKKAEKLHELSKFGFGKFVRTLTGSQSSIESDKKVVEEDAAKTRRGISTKLDMEAYQKELENSGDKASAKRQALADQQEMERGKFLGKSDNATLDSLDRKQKAERVSLELEIQMTEEAEAQRNARQAEVEAEKQSQQAKRDRAAATKEGDRTKSSLTDIAEHSPTYAEGGTIQTVYARQQAQEIQRLEASSKRKSLHQDFAGARQDLDRADKMRQDIGGLKDSDKQVGAFKAAIDSSQLTAEVKGLRNDLEVSSDDL